MLLKLILISSVLSSQGHRNLRYTGIEMCSSISSSVIIFIFLFWYTDVTFLFIYLCIYLFFYYKGTAAKVLPFLRVLFSFSPP